MARAFIEHRPPAPWKCWYAGSNFRYERPQAGRYREFHQVGIEAFGSADPDLDVEVMALGWEFYAALGLDRLELLLNSLGDAACRPAYRQLLLEYLRDHRAELCDEHQARLEENPLRVLDCKQPACQAVVAGAPRQIDHLCDDCAAHFARVEAGLEALDIPYTIDSTLVRGLDYYTRTTFEYVAPGAGVGPERRRRRRPLRRPGGGHGRPADPRRRLRPGRRADPAGRRRRAGRPAGWRPAARWTPSWSTSPAVTRRGT